MKTTDTEKPNPRRTQLHPEQVRQSKNTFGFDNTKPLSEAQAAYARQSERVGARHARLGDALNAHKAQAKSERESAKLQYLTWQLHDFSVRLDEILDLVWWSVDRVISSGERDIDE